MDYEKRCDGHHISETRKQNVKTAGSYNPRPISNAPHNEAERETFTRKQVLPLGRNLNRLPVLRLERFLAGHHPSVLNRYPRRGLYRLSLFSAPARVGRYPIALVHPTPSTPRLAISRTTAPKTDPGHGSAQTRLVRSNTPRSPPLENPVVDHTSAVSVTQWYGRNHQRLDIKQPQYQTRTVVPSSVLPRRYLGG